MKASRFTILFITPFVLLTFAGCYTQFATRDYQERIYSNESGDDYTRYGDESYDDTTYYEDDQSGYDESETVIENNYYFGGYPTYRRYYWGYYPSVSVGIYWGHSYYDPFCWDPFYWSAWYPGWCSPFYYTPVYVSYYPWYYYYPGYYYSHWDNGGGIYRERNRDRYALRNNDGLRNSFVSRGNLTRTNDRSITGDSRGLRDRDLLRDNKLRDRNRTALNERDRVITERKDLGRTRDNTRETLTSTRNKNTDRKGLTDRNDRTKRESLDRKRTVNPPRVFDRKKTEQKEIKRNDGNRNTGKDTQRFKAPEQKRNTDIKRDTRGNTKSPNVGTNRNTNPPRQTYNPPRQNNTPPRTNTTPPRTGGNNNSGSRNRGR